MKLRKSPGRVLSCAHPLMSIHEIVHWKKSRQHASGVYFLLKDDTVQYIGSSINVYSRIAQHIGNKVDFDSATIEFCAEHLILQREAQYIIKYNPPLNCVIPQFGGRTIPLRQKDNSSWNKPTGIDYAIDE